MKNIRKHVLISRANSVWYCMNNRGYKKKLTLEKDKKEETGET